ncbi:MAG: PH domain-containing protein [Fibrobacter sp.]|nr:PH domain-containing protein [Fibrobacter sp.]
MGLLNAILGNASQVEQSEIDEKFSKVLFPGETVEVGYKVIRDVWLFTSHRLIMLDVQGVTGRKKEYHTIPYASIRHFAVETAGTFDDDCEMKLFVADLPEPLKYELSRSVDVISIQKRLAEHICK